ncbi:MAG: serine/threonine protein kinase [Burkholderiales bacterium]|nr:serine/threonine protein kinase [Burkholderiales bacterium]
MTEALRTTPMTLGRYAIIEEIAQGAMGVVYKARDPLIDRIVAIKTIAIGLSDAETEAFERRFFREAKSAGRLNHPNVVTIHDVGKSGEIAYIAMEFLDGQSLRTVLDSGVVLPHGQIVDIVAQVADGLAFAHHEHIVHRDVKPANIMVLHNGMVKITDFGIALLPTGTRTLAGNVFGSPRYISPEQVMGRPVDGRSDIFSLGAVLYEMLTGVPPFSGVDLNSILTQVLSDPTPAPSSHNPTIPRAFDHIVGKALAKDPADRYQDAQEMAADLRNFRELELTSVAPAPLPALEHPTGGLVALLAEADAATGAAPLLEAESAPTWTPPIDVNDTRRKLVYVALALAGLAVAAAIGVAMWPSPAPAPDSIAVPASSTGASRSVAAAIAPNAAPPATPDGVAPAPADAATLPASPELPTIAASATPAPDAAAAAAPAPDEKTTAMAAASPPPPAAPRPTGRVALAVAPWGEIHVDGRKRGISPPLQELKLSPGKHSIEIRNGDFPPYRETIEVVADGVVRIKHKFP